MVFKFETYFFEIISNIVLKNSKTRGIFTPAGFFFVFAFVFFTCFFLLFFYPKLISSFFKKKNFVSKLSLLIFLNIKQFENLTM
jgi:hypothetical protein